jgi:hypothetical protein
MNWSDVAAVLNSLPSGYLRTGSAFAAWQNSLTAASVRFTGGVDAITAQTSFGAAVGHWLDVWGRMLGVLRNAGESDSDYRNRISLTLLSWRGTVVGIESYLELAMGLSAVVSESFPAVGWALNIQVGYALSAAQKSILGVNLAFVRPAGVPYTLNEVSGGLFLTTGNFLSGTRFPGSWLVSQNRLTGVAIPSTTNSPVSTLPTTWLTDRTLNP